MFTSSRISLNVIFMQMQYHRYSDMSTCSLIINILKQIPVTYIFFFLICSPDGLVCCPGFEWNKKENRCLRKSFHFIDGSIYLFKNLKFSIRFNLYIYSHSRKALQGWVLWIELSFALSVSTFWRELCIEM